jgi:hypothetical protein
MQGPRRIDVWEFEWDDANLEHQEHGLTPLLADEVKDRSPKFFANKPGKAGTHKMVGPDTNDRFWTIILLPTAHRGRWRPITGWPSTGPDAQRYHST